MIKLSVLIFKPLYFFLFKRSWSNQLHVNCPRNEEIKEMSIMDKTQGQNRIILFKLPQILELGQQSHSCISGNFLYEIL